MNNLGDTSPSNILKTEVAIPGTNISIVNKSQLLSGLNASAPPLGSIKRPIEGTDSLSMLLALSSGCNDLLLMVLLMGSSRQGCCIDRIRSHGCSKSVGK